MSSAINRSVTDFSYTANVANATASTAACQGRSNGEEGKVSFSPEPCFRFQSSMMHTLTAAETTCEGDEQCLVLAEMQSVFRLGVDVMPDVLDRAVKSKYTASNTGVLRRPSSSSSWCKNDIRLASLVTVIKVACREMNKFKSSGQSVHQHGFFTHKTPPTMNRMNETSGVAR
jgi:hypothetical protein